MKELCLSIEFQSVQKEAFESFWQPRAFKMSFGHSFVLALFFTSLIFQFHTTLHPFAADTLYMGKLRSGGITYYPYLSAFDMSSSSKESTSPEESIGASNPRS